MAHPLDGIRLKMFRAEEHLRALDGEIGVFLDGDVYDVVRDGSAKECVFILRVKAAPPAHLSVVLGDCLHNLRSSLDHLAWQLVLVNKNTPTRRTNFPIFKDPDLYRKHHGESVQGMSAAARALIESVQPYRAGNAAANTALWFLHELSNADKHRTLNMTIAALADPQGRLIVDQRELLRVPPVFIDGVTPRIARHGAELARFPFSLDEALQHHVEVEARGRSFVALDDPGPWGEYPVTVLVEKVYQFIRDDLLPAFEPFFDQQPNPSSP